MTRLGPSSLRDTFPADNSSCMPLPQPAGLWGPLCSCQVFLWGPLQVWRERPSSDLSQWVRQVNDTFTLCTALRADD